jgi:hypothetical protein
MPVILIQKFTGNGIGPIKYWRVTPSKVRPRKTNGGGNDTFAPRSLEDVWVIRPK